MLYLEVSVIYVANNIVRRVGIITGAGIKAFSAGMDIKGQNTSRYFDLQC